GVAGLHEVLFHAPGGSPGASAVPVLLPDGAPVSVLRRYAVVRLHVGRGHLGCGSAVSAGPGFLRRRAGGCRWIGLGGRERAEVVRAAERGSVAGGGRWRAGGGRYPLGGEGVAGGV